MPTQIGDEFRINTTTNGRQTISEVATLSDGRFVVTWIDEDTFYDASGGIRAQIFDAQGAKVGGEIAVNTIKNQFQGYPSIAAVGTGFVITWEDWSQSAGDTSQTAVRAQRFDSAGAKVGTEFLVNTTTAGDQQGPVVAGFSGGFAIAWTHTEGPSNPANVLLQLYNADGTKNGGEVVVNTFLQFNQSEPSIAGLTGGGFVVVWDDNAGNTGDQFGSVRGQRFDATGAKVGTEFLVNTVTSGTQSDTDVHARADGGFVVVYHSDGGIRAQNFDAAGAKVGAEVLIVAAATNVSLITPDIVSLPNGGYVAMWWHNNMFAPTGTEGNAVWLQEVSADGVKVGDAVRINTATLGEQSRPSASLLSDGRIIVTWEDRSGSLGDGDAAIHAKIFSTSASGGPSPTTGPDNLTGTTGPDTIDGLAGDDFIAGGDGIDTLNGGVGEDQLYGQAGNDILRDGGETSNRDYLYGGAGNDTYYVNSSLTGPLDLVYEGGSNPDLAAGIGDVDVIHSEGEFFWDYYGVAETLYIDRVSGGQIVGGTNSQSFFGSAASDQIIVYGGSNRVDAGAGADAVSFGLYGLAESFDGVNTLVMKAGNGADYVYEFESGVDKVDLTAFSFGITGAQVLAQAVNVDNAGTANDYCYFYLTNAGGVDNFVVFMGLLSSQLSASDFVT